MTTTTDFAAKHAARASAAAAMQAAFPHLVPVGGKVDRLTAAAKNIRIELKAAFPRVKFSVKTSRYSGGDNINITWTDGPNAAQVCAITDRYSGGSFDGSTDCYNYSRDAWTDAFGDSKFIFERRENSDAAITSAIRTVHSRYRIEEATVSDFRSGSLWRKDTGYRSVHELVEAELSKRTWAIARKPG